MSTPLTCSWRIMSEQISFVERVRRVITDVAAEYESYFVRYDYLLCSLEVEFGFTKTQERHII